MKLSQKKQPEAKGLLQQSRQQAGHAHQHNHVIAQSKHAVPVQNVRRPVAPPVYNPQSKPTAAQAKMAGSSQMKTRPAAPPAYRPQPVQKVLQAKTAQQTTPVQLKANHQQPTAPPVYRPQPTPRVLQQKAATERPAAAQTKRAPVASPAYRPPLTPRVLQTKKIHQGEARPSAAGSETKVKAAGNDPRAGSILQRSAGYFNARALPARYVGKTVIQRAASTIVEEKKEVKPEDKKEEKKVAEVTPGGAEIELNLSHLEFNNVKQLFVIKYRQIEHEIKQVDRDLKANDVNLAAAVRNRDTASRLLAPAERLLADFKSDGSKKKEAELKSRQDNVATIKKQIAEHDEKIAGIKAWDEDLKTDQTKLKELAEKEEKESKEYLEEQKKLVDRYEKSSLSARVAAFKASSEELSDHRKARLKSDLLTQAWMRTDESKALNRKFKEHIENIQIPQRKKGDRDFIIKASQRAEEVKFPQPVGNAIDLAKVIIKSPTSGRTGFKVRGRDVYHTSARSSVHPGTAFWININSAERVVVAMGAHINSTTYQINWHAPDVKVDTTAKNKQVTLNSVKDRLAS